MPIRRLTHIVCGRHCVPTLNCTTLKHNSFALTQTLAKTHLTKSPFQEVSEKQHRRRNRSYTRFTSESWNPIQRCDLASAVSLIQRHLTKTLDPSETNKSKPSNSNQLRLSHACQVSHDITNTFDWHMPSQTNVFN